MEENKYVNPVKPTTRAKSLWNNYKILVIGIIIIITIILLMAAWTYFSKPISLPQQPASQEHLTPQEQPVQQQAPQPQQAPSPQIPQAQQVSRPQPEPIHQEASSVESIPQEKLVNSIFEEQFEKTQDDVEFLKYTNIKSDE